MAKEIIITVICILVLFCLWMAIYDTNRFTVSSYEYRNSRIKKKIRAVVISDLHDKIYGRENERLLNAIVSQKPDVILMTGDILNGHPGENTDTALSFTGKLAKIAPVYYGIGNHELRMRIYPEKYGNKYEGYISALREAGVKILSNETAEIAETGVKVTGADIPSEYYKRFKQLPMDKNKLADLMGEPDRKFFNILLAHNPAYFENYVEYGSDLVLSGHVHGGIIRIPFAKKGLLSPNISFFPKYDGGEYTKNKTSMIVSRGLGVHTIPFRLFNPGDLVVIDLTPVK